MIELNTFKNIKKCLSIFVKHQNILYFTTCDLQIQKAIMNASKTILRPQKKCKNNKSLLWKTYVPNKTRPRFEILLDLLPYNGFGCT